MTELVKPARDATEGELLQYVRDAAAWGGWLCYHTHDSRRSPEGFPDIVAVHAGLGRLVFAELKSAKGKVTPDQGEWLSALRHNRGVHHDGHWMPEVYLWRPADADEIETVFLAHRQQRQRSTPTESQACSLPRDGKP